MEIFNGSPSTSSSASYGFNPTQQASREWIATQVDVSNPGGMHVDPDSDGSASSDTDSWRSAEENFDDHKERPQSPAPPPHVSSYQLAPPSPSVKSDGKFQDEDQEDPYYVDPAFEAAMSQLSVEALASRKYCGIISAWRSN